MYNFSPSNIFEMFSHEHEKQSEIEFNLFAYDIMQESWI